MKDEILERQERTFARAFESHDLEIARPLYATDVVYRSPTVRLFERRGPIVGIDETLAFIERTIRGCHNIGYRAVERAALPDGSGFVRVEFDWDAGSDFDAEKGRLRSSYVVLYRYRDALIAGQELYYDPSGELQKLG